jgi:hypothetical protein
MLVDELFKPILHNLQIDDWQPILIMALIFAFTLTFFLYVFSTIKYSAWYPIRELTPMLTIMQQIGLYLFVIIILILILFSITGNDNYTKTNLLFQMV